MALYLIGDIQGCDEALGRLLQTVDFSPSRDTLYVLGDLVNRGPDSDRVLRRLMGYRDAARCLLGNHDLHLLAVAHGVRPPKRKDTLDCILQAPDRRTLLDWLQNQSLAQRISIGGQDVLMVHAGILPGWSADDVMALAAEVEAVLRGPEAADFFRHMYANEPDHWDPALRGHARIRLVVNALTRLRYCTAQGVMEFDSKGATDDTPHGYLPWFDVPQRRSAHTVVAFGHWSTVGWLNRSDVFALDQGCVWGGKLAALRLPNHEQWTPELVTIDCPAMQAPGG